MEFWLQILSKLLENKAVYLLTVIDNSGSSPGRKGFKMLVAEDGFIFGSIGGGVMEFLLVEEVKALLKTESLSIFLKNQIHKRQAENGSGMICSGEQTIVFHPLTEKHVPIIQEIIDSLKQNRKGILNLTQNSVEFSKNVIAQQFHCTIHSELNWHYQEFIGFKEKLYIVGGGHVSLAVSELFVSLGFFVTILDDRENLNTFELNTTAHHKSIISFNEVNKYIPEGPETYVTIMTNKYISDKNVLKQLLSKEFKYIGVLGSIAKLNTMWSDFKKEGIEKEKLQHIHAPIGMPIKSQTPKEIAVSIAAQIIQTRNTNK